MWSRGRGRDPGYGRSGETSKSQKCKSARTKCKSRLLHRAKSTIDVHHLPNFDVCSILLPSPETAFGTKVQKCQTAEKVDFCTLSVALLHFCTLIVSPDLRYFGCFSRAVTGNCKSELLRVCRASRVVGSRLSTLQKSCLLYTSPSPRDQRGSRMPSSA